jgi:acyl-CoA reductase-like NAD-dependent aldehyde dehydrogenase
MSPRPSRPPGRRSTPADGRGPRRPGERGSCAGLGELISERADDLARLQVRENGTVLREVLAQTKGLTDYCNYFAG